MPVIKNAPLPVEEVGRLALRFALTRVMYAAAAKRSDPVHKQLNAAIDMDEKIVVPFFGSISFHGAGEVNSQM